MSMCFPGHQMLVTETSKTIDFWGCFIYNIAIQIERLSSPSLTEYARISLCS